MCMCAFDQDGFTHTVHTAHMSSSLLPPPHHYQLQNHDIAYNCEVVKPNNHTWAQRFKYKHQCTNNPVGKNGPKQNGSRPERTKLINNDMWLVQSANTKQTFTLIWFSFFFFLNNQEMWVSESFLCALSVIQLIKSSTKPEPRLYVHIWQNNHQIYKGNHVSLVVGCLPWWYWQDLYIVTISGKIITILDTAVITISLVNIIIIITQYFTYSKSLIN